MVNIPIIKEMDPKSISILFLIILIVIGLLVGVVLSAGSINLANQRVKEIDPEAEVDPVYPFLGITIITINIFILCGLIYTHILIFKKTKSKFLIGLILFLSALLIKSLFAYASIQLLAIATELKYSNVAIVENLTFSITGFAGIILLYHMFEFFVVSIFFYVSRE
jgi:hypothetical protein